MLALRRSFAIGGMVVATIPLAACARSTQSAPSVAPPAGATSSPVSARDVIANDSIEALTSGGVERRYRLHISTAYQASQPIPLVINLHGYNSNAMQQEQVSEMSAKADRAGFIIAYPEGLGDPQSWKFGDRAEGQADVAFIRDLIRHLQDQFSVDSRRIYVTGISNTTTRLYFRMGVRGPLAPEKPYSVGVRGAAKPPLAPPLRMESGGRSPPDLPTLVVILMAPR